MKSKYAYILMLIIVFVEIIPEDLIVGISLAPSFFKVTMLIVFLTFFRNMVNRKILLAFYLVVIIMSVLGIYDNSQQLIGALK